MLELLIGLALLAAFALVPFIALARASRALRAVDDLRRELRRALVDLRAAAAMPETPTVAPPPEPVSDVGSALHLRMKLRRTDEGRLKPAPTTVTPAATTAAESLEARIGGRWLLYLGVGAIVIAAGYFVKLAIDNQWITETMRVVIGAGAGLGMVWAGGRFARKGYPLYGQMLAGGGIAILYLSVYAAFNFYALVGRTPAFGLMVVVTGLAAWLADSQRAQGLALMAVGGGFFTPFLIGGDIDAQTALFGYDAILVAGTAYLSRRRDWPGLNLVSYWLTLVTIAGWFTRFYTDAAYLRTVLFLTLFCALFGYILARSWRSPHPLGPLVRFVLATAPPAYYVTSVILLYSHSVELLVFLVAVTLVGLVIARRAGSAWGRLALWFVVAWPLAVWMAEQAGPSWFVAGTTVAVAIFALHLATQLDVVRREDREVPAADVVLLHVNGLGLYGLIYLLFDLRGVGTLGGAAAILAIANAALAAGTRRLREELAFHFAGVGAALGTMAVALWSGGAWATLGLAVEASALVAIGLRTRREWLRLGGGLLLGLATLWWVGLEFQPVSTEYTVVLNARTAAAAILIALCYGLARLHRRQTGDLAERARPDSDFFLLASNTLLLVTITTEINAFWEFRGGGRPSALSQQASLAIAWTLQAIGVIRVGLSRRSAVLQGAGLLLVFAPFAWLSFTLWADVIDRVIPPAGYVVLVNARAAAAIVLIGSLYGLIMMLRRAAASLGAGGRYGIAAVAIGASLVTVGWLSAESSAFWYLRDAKGGDPRLVFQFARELTLSVLWASYAAALVAVGIQRRFAPIRHFAIGLFLVTVAKVGLVDLAELERLYRVLSIMALGVLLLVASYLYQRFRDRLAGAPDL